MITAESFIIAARERGFQLYSGVPCSFLKPLINGVIDSQHVRYVGAANEGDAVAIAAGAELGGQPGVVMIQNSGLGNAVNPLTSLTYTFKIPILLIVTLRGDPEGPRDEPQHELMGSITTRLLDLMQIPWDEFPAEEGRLVAVLDRVLSHTRSAGTPFALVMKQGTMASHPLRAQAEPRLPSPAPTPPVPTTPRATRREMLRAIQSVTTAADVVVATTGYTGRELTTLDDRENQLAMVGSMGCCSSLCLGLALAQPQRRVLAIDGDGAIMMRLGVLTTIGFERPKNLVHIVLDNQVHESTGGQATVSHSLDLGGIAAACGYQSIARPETPEELATVLCDRAPGLRFVHVRIKPGTPGDLPRPAIPPPAAANRFRVFLRRTP